MTEKILTLFVGDNGVANLVMAEYSDKEPWEFIKISDYPTNPIKRLINRKKYDHPMMGNLEREDHQNFQLADPWTKKVHSDRKFRIVFCDLMGNKGTALREKYFKQDPKNNENAALIAQNDKLRLELAMLVRTIREAGNPELVNKSALKTLEFIKDAKSKMFTGFDYGKGLGK